MNKEKELKPLIKENESHHYDKYLLKTVGYYNTKEIFNVVKLLKQGRITIYNEKQSCRKCKLPIKLLIIHNNKEFCKNCWIDECFRLEEEE